MHNIENTHTSLILPWSLRLEKTVYKTPHSLESLKTTFQDWQSARLLGRLTVFVQSLAVYKTVRLTVS